MASQFLPFTSFSSAVSQSQSLPPWTLFAVSHAASQSVYFVAVVTIASFEHVYWPPQMKLTMVRGILCSILVEDVGSLRDTRTAAAIVVRACPRL